jgi:hypothetical protein
VVPGARGCGPPPQPVKIRPRRTSTSIIAGDLSSHQSKYVWVWETSVPGPGRALTFLEELSTSSCPNTPGDVQGPLKKPPMRPVLSRFLYKLKTGFLTLPRRFTPLARVKLQGASRTVQSTYQQRVVRHAETVSATAWKYMTKRLYRVERAFSGRAALRRVKRFSTTPRR